MKKPKIGKGKNMSIARAALIFFYEEFLPGEIEPQKAYLNYGHLDHMHRIVEIAGAKQASFFTHAQVSGRLASSPLWDHKLIAGFASGMRGHGSANVYRPNLKGEQVYNKTLKNRKKDDNKRDQTKKK